MSISNASGRGGDNKSPQPFATHALEYYQLGLSLIPCHNKRQKQGKEPLLYSITQYRSRIPRTDEMRKWLNEFPYANIGLLTGAINNITIIDSDSSSFSVEALEKEFGESKFIVSSPKSGRHHLYYQHTGEPTKIDFDGRRIDVIGIDSYIIAPPSFNPAVQRYYKLIKGDLSDLTNLSRLKVDLTTPWSKKAASRIKEGDANSDIGIEEGRRNEYLFNQLRRAVRSCRNYESLEEKASAINNLYLFPPLSESEVIGTAKQVWKYKVTGTLISSSGRFVLLRKEEMEVLDEHPRAEALLSRLRLNHDGLKRDFCIDQIEVSKKFKMNRKTLRRTIDVLLEKKLLFRRENKFQKTYKDGKIKTSPYIYSLCRG